SAASGSSSCSAPVLAQHAGRVSYGLGGCSDCREWLHSRLQAAEQVDPAEAAGLAQKLADLLAVRRVDVLDPGQEVADVGFDGILGGAVGLVAAGVGEEPGAIALEHRHDLLAQRGDRQLEELAAQRRFARQADPL